MIDNLSSIDSRMSFLDKSLLEGNFFSKFYEKLIFNNVQHLILNFNCITAQKNIKGFG
jgi:hypothetical protein